jgi:release factor glutamine methyltransferase
MVLKIRYQLFQTHRSDRLVMEYAAGYPLIVLPQVFNPRLFRSGAFLARALDDRMIPENSRVLDMGTGSGIGAIAAARRAGEVLAVDRNPAAIRCAAINILLNGVEDRVKVKGGDLFDGLEGRRFQVVLFNPPYFHGEPKDLLDGAWRSPDTIDRFARGLPDYLTEDGSALVVFSTDGDVEAFLSCFLTLGYRVELLKSLDLINEILILYRMLPPGGKADDAPAGTH